MASGCVSVYRTLTVVYERILGGGGGKSSLKASDPICADSENLTFSSRISSKPVDSLMTTANIADN